MVAVSRVVPKSSVPLQPGCFQNRHFDSQLDRNIAGRDSFSKDSRSWRVTSKFLDSFFECAAFLAWSNPITKKLLEAAQTASGSFFSNLIRQRFYA